MVPILKLHQKLTSNSLVEKFIICHCLLAVSFSHVGLFRKKIGQMSLDSTTNTKQWHIAGVGWRPRWKLQQDGISDLPS